MKTLCLKRVPSLLVCVSLIQSTIACAPFTEDAQRQLLADCSDAAADAGKGITRTLTSTIAARNFACRVEQLVSRVQRKDDISPEILNKRMGIQLVPDEKFPDYYHASGHIAQDLDYWLVIFDGRKSGKSSHLTFSYSSKNEDTNPEPHSEYALKFKDLREVFLSTGYRQIDEQGSSIFFIKKSSYVLLFLFNESGTDIENTYVKKIDVAVY